MTKESKDVPILMSGPMVTGILDQSKTETRRTRGLTEVNEWLTKPKSDIHCDGINYRDQNIVSFQTFQDRKGYSRLKIKFPYGGRGTRLWVRETWAVDKKHNKLSPSKIPKGIGVYYRQTSNSSAMVLCGTWRPSIFMCRWASRIQLEVLDWTCERLHQIDEQGAANEGIVTISRSVISNGLLDGYGPPGTKPQDASKSRVEGYRQLWNQINGRGTFDLNPFVWVIKFKRVG